MAGYVVPGNLMAPSIATVFTDAAPVTPADNTAIGPFRALYVGTAGNVALVPLNTVTPVVFTAVPGGTVLPVAFQGINATNTTALALVGLG